MAGRDGKLVRMLLMFLLMSGPLFFSGCDLDWEETAEAAYRAGIIQQDKRQFTKAKALYELALQNNPFHASANWRLGWLYNVQFFAEPDAAGHAIHYYRRFLDLPATDRSLVVDAEASVKILLKIRKGKLEDPVYAVEDLILAMKNASMRAFAERIHPALFLKLRDHDISPKQYLEMWTKRTDDTTTKVLERQIYQDKTGLRAMVVMKLVSTKKRTQQHNVMLMAGKGGRWDLAGIDKSK